MGKLKKEKTMTEQAYRYPKDTWTESEARDHCDEHKGSFTPASDEKESIRLTIPDILNAPWAILPEKLEQIHAIYQAHIFNEKIDIAAIEAQTGKSLDNKTQNYKIENGVAIIPINGIIARKMNLFMAISGGTSTEFLIKDFLDALSNPQVDAILLNIDSPGGAVGGLEPLASLIYSSRGTKPIITFANDIMTSAAYWVGSAADYIIAESTSEVGSIGVVTIHYDYSVKDEKAGIKRTFISSGKYKALGNDAEQLSVEARQEIQGILDYIYTIFVDTIARHRGADSNTVLNTMADGKIFIGQQAFDAGLIDGLGTIDDAIYKALSMTQVEKPKYFR
jgi:signal peptide peptidase SppA